ncbi:hypothetical protein CCP2SC5_80035 [Azospirillaceae bacterium]
MIHTLAGLLPAKIHASHADEKDLAAAALKSAKLRVFLHLEQPLKHSTLFPRAIDPADVQQKLRQALKPIDAHPKVVETSRTGSSPWKVYADTAQI